MKNADLPAMPQPDIFYPNGDIEYGYSGLTKREELAARFYAAILASGDIIVEWDKAVVAKDAVEHAEALLAELEKAQQGAS